MRTTTSPRIIFHICCWPSVGSWSLQGTFSRVAGEISPYLGYLYAISGKPIAPVCPSILYILLSTLTTWRFLLMSFSMKSWKAYCRFCGFLWGKKDLWRSGVGLDVSRDPQAWPLKAILNRSMNKAVTKESKSKNQGQRPT